MYLLQPLLAYGDWGLLLLRLALGVLFIIHGRPKLFGSQPGIKGFSGWLKSMNVPAAPFFGVVVPLIEFFGGIALIVGFGTQYAALLLTINMIVAGFLKKTKMGKGFMGDGGFELDLALAAALLVLLTIGPGRFSFDL